MSCWRSCQLWIPQMDTNELLERYSAGERDFRGVDLQQINLSEVNLTGVIFRRVNLADANLSLAVLQEVNLNQ
ncbi:MAG: pentapeptide repeat-containing protein, partial [Moorea sp. SIO2I5]|nr:pentapeptide repeat-containing protein [Moorena sp. SIO2I5]